MACGVTIAEAHGELTEVEARLAAEFADACTHEPVHVGDHRYPARDGSGRVLHCTTTGKLSIWPPD